MFPVNTIPSVRLQRYQKFFKLVDQTHENIRAVYLWNLALTQQLMPVIALLEVSLRTKVDSALNSQFGQAWLTQSWPQFQPRERGKLIEAEKNIRATSTHDDIVAQLNFGFWVNLFDGPYRQHVWYKQATLKTNLLEEINHVDYLCEKAWASKFYGDLKPLKDLRNRMFHHEAIFDYNKGKLDETYKNGVRLLNALCPQTHNQLHRVDTFIAVWGKGQGWQRYK